MAYKKKKKNNSKDRRKQNRAHLQWIDPSLVTQRVVRNVKLENEAMTTTSVPTVKKFYSSDMVLMRRIWKRWRANHKTLVEEKAEKAVKADENRPVGYLVPLSTHDELDMNSVLELDIGHPSDVLYGDCILDNF